jgi:hypothetical protein
MGDGATGLTLTTGAAGRTFITNWASPTAANDIATAIIKIIFEKYFFIKICFIPL